MYAKEKSGRASHSGEIALAGSRCQRPMLAAAPVLFAHDVVTLIEIREIKAPNVMTAFSLNAQITVVNQLCQRPLARLQRLQAL